MLGLGGAAQGGEREVEWLPPGDRRLADLTGGDLDVRLGDRGDNVLGR